MTRTIFVPVGYAEAADRIAELVNRGLIPMQDHWRSKQACQTYINSLPNYGEAGGLITSTIEYMATPVVIRVAGDAGRAAPFPPPSQPALRLRQAFHECRGSAARSGERADRLPARQWWCALPRR